MSQINNGSDLYTFIYIYIYIFRKPWDGSESDGI